MNTIWFDVRIAGAPWVNCKLEIMHKEVAQLLWDTLSAEPRIHMLSQRP